MIALRPSMIKFESDTRNLEVCEYSRHKVLYLNRQIIMGLLSLGVPERVFLDMFQELTHRLNKLIEGGEPALQMSPGPHSISHVLPNYCPLLTNSI